MTPTLRVVVAAVAALWSVSAFAKTPGQTYCFRGICHRVLTIEQTQGMVGKTETVVASFYDDPKVDGANPNIMTSSGERFDARSDKTVASPIYPNGTRLLLWNPKTRAAAEVRVTNSGPYHGVRRLDVSAVAAEKLGFRRFGVSQIAVTVIAAPSAEEARYIKGRRYASVPGYLGVFESHDAAHLAVRARQPTAAGAIASIGIAPPAPLRTAGVGWVTTTRPALAPLRRGEVKTLAKAAPPASPVTAPMAVPVTTAGAANHGLRGTALPDWTTTSSQTAKSQIPASPPSSSTASSTTGADGKALGLR